jgi:hypothetical protein
MLSKCANPECSQQFLYLHQGKLFCLTPSPNLQTLAGKSCEFLYERFWLCDQCSRTMTLAWNGSEAKIVHLPAPPNTLHSDDSKQFGKDIPPRTFAASAGHPHG